MQHFIDWLTLVAWVAAASGLLFAATIALGMLLSRWAERQGLSTFTEHRLVPDEHATYPTADTRRAVARAYELEDAEGEAIEGAA